MNKTSHHIFLSLGHKKLVENLIFIRILFSFTHTDFIYFFAHRLSFVAFL